MDGNGRWAKKRGLERSAGHKAAAERIKALVEYCFKRGIKVVSLFAFSTENWNRPQEEIETLFGILRDFFAENTEMFEEHGIRGNLMGDISSLPEDIRISLQDELAKSAHCDRFVLNVGLNYGSRDEILRAVNALIKEGKTEVDEAAFRDKLYTDFLPDPDLIIRTSGEMRLSNFMLFQAAYSELYFTKVLWPDFNERELEKALQNYAKRERRFGRV